jgi:hypothetical protein
MECAPFCEPVHIRMFALADKSGHVRRQAGQHARICAQALRHRPTRRDHGDRQDRGWTGQRKSLP